MFALHVTRIGVWVGIYGVFKVHAQIILEDHAQSDSDSSSGLLVYSCYIFFEEAGVKYIALRIYI